MAGLPQWLATGALVVQLCSVGLAQTKPSGTIPLSTIVESVEKTHLEAHAKNPYQVVREYRLSGAHDSSSNSNVVAEITFMPPSKEQYRIEKSSGSSRGQQVVRHVLDHEVEASLNRNQARSALSRDNYDFEYLGEALLGGQPCYLLSLKPKRKEKELISGQAWVEKGSLIVRQVEGDLAKSPSWWLRKVHVKLAFGDMGGTIVETSMEAVADVRVVGPHTLTSHILDYRNAEEVASIAKSPTFSSHR